MSLPLGFFPPLAPFLPTAKKIANDILDPIRKKAESGEQLTDKDLADIFLFSPLALEDVDQELVMFGAAAIGLYLSKTDKGMDLLNTMAKQYFGTISDIVSSVSKGASTNVFSSLHSQMITIRLLRRLGLISNAEANAIHHEICWTINKIFITETIGDIMVAAGTVFGGIGKALVAGA